MQASSDDLASRAHGLLQEQMKSWPLLRHGVAALEMIETRTIELDGFTMRLQHNPRRLVSSAAKVDDRSIAERKCFLCNANLPPQQRGVTFGDYIVLCNPFPIFPEHFTIPHREHRPQRIAESFGAMLQLAQAMQSRYTVFYNGPRCGASAPDHLHFQAGDRGFMLIEADYEREKGDPLIETPALKAYAVACMRSYVALESRDASALANAFARLVAAIQDVAPAKDDEPMMNILAWFESGMWKVIVFPRGKHRPSFFFADGVSKLLLSPASVDLGGVCILPVEQDFRRLTKENLVQMFHEVMLTREQFGALCKRLHAAL